MTRKKVTPLPSAMLTQLVDIVCNAKSDNEIRRNAITIAYEIGKTDGRLEGAQSMADRLVPQREIANAN